MHFILLSCVPVSLLVASAPAFVQGKSTAVAASKSAGSVHVTVGTYHGWPDSIIVSNGEVEAVIVPAVGRVMQFHFIGGGDVLFENRDLDGKAPDPASSEWVNFGGDKTWPSPQTDWPKMTKRSWPPPANFDAVAVNASVEKDAVELVSPVDAAYGIRTRRRIELDPHKPVMSITTAYEKVSGNPVKVGVWVITQMADPQRAFLVLPPMSAYPEGYTLLMGKVPQDLRVEDGLLSLTRDHRNESTIGTDGDTLIWMNEKYALRIDAPRLPGAEYPDQGSSTEIYTNEDPLAYIELETEGPLSIMKIGDRIQRTNTYTLSRRSEKDPAAEARKILGR